MFYSVECYIIPTGSTPSTLSCDRQGHHTIHRRQLCWPLPATLHVVNELIFSERSRDRFVPMRSTYRCGVHVRTGAEYVPVWSMYRCGVRTLHIGQNRRPRTAGLVHKNYISTTTFQEIHLVHVYDIAVTSASAKPSRRLHSYIFCACPDNEHNHGTVVM